MRKKALDTVFQLAKSDPRVVFIGSDLGVGTLDEMKQMLPNQFYMEGISEQHLIGFASGLAKEGFIPYLNTIANFFTRRALEQLILDVALHSLPVKILASGGGMVYAPLGPTHTATDDLAHLLAIPNFNVYCPSDSVEMELEIRRDLTSNAPAYFRFGKGGEKVVSNTLNTSDDFGFKYKGALEAPIAIVTTGMTLQNTLEAYDDCSIQNQIEIIHLVKVNIEKSTELISHFKNKKHILVVEEHQEYGGIFTQLLHVLNKNNLVNCRIDAINLGKSFIRHYGSQSDHFANFGMDTRSIKDRLERLIG